MMCHLKLWRLDTFCHNLFYKNPNNNAPFETLKTQNLIMYLPDFFNINCKLTWVMQRMLMFLYIISFEQFQKELWYTIQLLLNCQSELGGQLFCCPNDTFAVWKIFTCSVIPYQDETSGLWMQRTMANLHADTISMQINVGDGKN